MGYDVVIVYDEKELEKIFSKILKINISKEISKPKEDRILYIHCDDETETYIIKTVEETKNRSIKEQEELEKKKSELKKLKGIEEKYYNCTEIQKPELIKKLENVKEKIPELEKNIYSMETQMAQFPINFIGQDVIVYAVNKNKNDTEFEYYDDKISLEEFRKVCSIENLIKMIR